MTIKRRRVLDGKRHTVIRDMKLNPIPEINHISDINLDTVESIVTGKVIIQVKTNALLKCTVNTGCKSNDNEIMKERKKERDQI